MTSQELQAGADSETAFGSLLLYTSGLPLTRGKPGMALGKLRKRSSKNSDCGRRYQY